MKYTVGIILAALLIIGGVYTFSNQSNSPSDDGSTLTIAASFYPLAFAAEEITGDLATVTNIGAGRDPHDVQLSTKDVLTMQEADLVVLQGADLEPWGDDMIEQLKAENVPVFIATTHMTLMESDEHHEHDTEDEHGSHDHEDDEHAHEHAEDEDNHDDEHADESEHNHDDEHGHDHGEFDPHTWLDPVLFSETVEHLTEAIIALDPDNTATYEENAAALQAELAALDAEYERRLSSCALNEVITSHDAFGYLGERYDFTIHSIAGISTQDLPSTAVLATLKEEAEEGVDAILLEENSVSAYGDALARETGLKTLPINPVAFSIPEGDNYLRVMRSNLDTFVVALACDE